MLRVLYSSAVGDFIKFISLSSLRILRVNGSFAAEKGGNGRVIYFF
jgi:hypothetical protein